MPYIHDDILDAACSKISADTENLYITSQEAITYLEAQTTYKLGTKATPGFTGPANGDVSGRKITINAITDGVVDATGTASHWALCDNSLSKLLCTGALTTPQGVTATNTFTLTAFDVEFPDPA
jgi:hypothetical protein